MKKRKPVSKLDRLLRSHKHLLKVMHGQIEEIGELRKLMLEIRERSRPISDQWLAEQKKLALYAAENEKRYAGVKDPAPVNAEHIRLVMHGDDWHPNDWPRL